MSFNAVAALGVDSMLAVGSPGGTISLNWGGIGSPQWNARMVAGAPSDWNAAVANPRYMYLFGNGGEARISTWSSNPTFAALALSPPSTESFRGATSGYVVSTVKQVWVVGTGGAIYTIREDSTQRILVAENSGTTENLNSVMALPGTPAILYAVGDRGTILKRDAQGVWAPEASPTTESLYGVFMSWKSDSRVCAVGAQGIVLCLGRNPSATWSAMRSGTTQSLRAGVGAYLSTTATNLDFVVGDNGTVLYR